MIKIWIIAFNTFREAIRNKVLYSLFFFALLVIFGSAAFGSLAVQNEARLTTDLGVGGMSLFAVIIAIFIGINLVYKELERKTVYTLIPKPIRRYQFVIGKYVGLELTLGVLVTLMSLTLVVVLLIKDAPVGTPLLLMVFLIFLEISIVTAVAVLFSSFSTPFLSGMFTVGIFLLGRSVLDIRLVAQKTESPVLGSVLSFVGRVVPDLRFFFVSGSEIEDTHVTVNGVFVDWSYVGSGAIYAGLYIAVILLLAAVLFSRRDFV